MDVLVNFSDFVSFQLKAFKLTGLVSHETDNQQSRRLKLLQKIYHYFVIVSITYFLITLIYSMIQNIGDLALFSEILSTVGYGSLAIVRMISINLARNEFGDLMKTLEELFPKSKEDQKTFETRKCYKNFNRMRQVVSSFIMSGGIIFLVILLAKFILTGVWINKLPFPNWFPFNPYNPLIYNFVLLWQSHIIICINSSLVGPDMMLYAFCTLIRMEFDNLSQRTRDLKDVPPKNAIKMLNELVERHKILIRLSENLEKIFSVPIFFNFFDSSVLICMYGYQLTIADTFTELIQYTNLLAVTLVQVFMICYYGNKLTIASATFAQAFYDSGWNERPFQSENKNFVLILLRSQKPIVITACKFAVVSLEVYFTVSLNMF